MNLHFNSPAQGNTHATHGVRWICVALLVLLPVLSCTGIPKSLPDDISVPDLLVKAQTAYDGGKYKTAEYYYNAAIARSTDNMQQLIPAEYELAHMYIKRKQWTSAESVLKQILSYYNNPESYSYPQEYKKLSELDLAKIPASKTSAAE